MSDSNDIDEFIPRLLKLIAKYEFWDELFWDEHMRFSVNCNDAFWWGCADLEEITIKTIYSLEQSLNDSEYHGMFLYCARQRNMRPQGAMYKHIDKKDWPLFDACGPEREIGLGNPHSPMEYI